MNKKRSINFHFKVFLVFFSFLVSKLFHQGRQTESVLPDGAPGETAAGTGTDVPTLLAYTGITGPFGANAALGIRKANCPSVAGTIWKPPYTLVASEGKLAGDEAPLQDTAFMGRTCGDELGICTIDWAKEGCVGPAAVGIWCWCWCWVG